MPDLYKEHAMMRRALGKALKLIDELFDAATFGEEVTEEQEEEWQEEIDDINETADKLKL